MGRAGARDRWRRPGQHMAGRNRMTLLHQKRPLTSAEYKRDSQLTGAVPGSSRSDFQIGPDATAGDHLTMELLHRGGELGGISPLDLATAYAPKSIAPIAAGRASPHASRTY